MLIHAFAGEILERVKIEPLRRALEDELVRAARAEIWRRSTRHDARRRTDARRSGARRRAGPRGFPDSAAAGRTASRSSISTTRRRRRSRRSVIDAITRYYERGQRQRPSRRARAERARDRRRTRARGARSRAFINAAHEREIIFTRNATESINLVAHAFGRDARRRRRRGAHLGDGAPLEHRAVADAVRASAARQLRVVPIDDAAS